MLEDPNRSLPNDWTQSYVYIYYYLIDEMAKIFGFFSYFLPNQINGVTQHRIPITKKKSKLWYLNDI